MSKVKIREHSAEMMEHIRQFDWCASTYESTFVNEKDLDECVTQKILRNKFYDPLVSSDEDEPRQPINWDEVFKKKNNDGEHNFRTYVPCMRAVPGYPKLSALSNRQHVQCLKVLCSQNPHVLPGEFLPRPTKQDYRVFEELKETYEKEQKEYLEWAKSLWTTSHCVRALRPKPTTETVYEAEFRMRAHEVQSFPKNYTMVAQIPLETKGNSCEFVHKKDLTKVNISDLPQVDYPKVLTKKLSVIRPSAVPEPCTKHPCKFILPNETSVSILPLTEVHRELAQYAIENGAKYVASENALRCLLETDRAWALPVSVCEALSPDGEKHAVAVLGSSFSPSKDAAQARTYKAYRHMLELAFIPISEQVKLMRGRTSSARSSTDCAAPRDGDSSDDEDRLLIDDTMDEEQDEKTEDTADNVRITRSKRQGSTNDRESSGAASPVRKKPRTRQNEQEDVPLGDQANRDGFGIFSCVCKDSLFERPPPRSFRKWEVRNKSNGEEYSLIVHCSHKAKDNSTEVILEPIPEYQIDLGGTLQSKEKLTALALSLMLRRNATLVSVRVDGGTGDVVTIETHSAEELSARHGDVSADIANSVYSALSQIHGLMPGHYVLQHEPHHTTNAMLFSSRWQRGGHALTLDSWNAAVPEADEARGVQAPPALGPILLPYHKCRKILPLAFGSNEKWLAKEVKKPPQRQRTPPQALKWPKKSKRGRGRGRGRGRF